jgi:RNA polymerase sigma factor (sigma-70 family)
MDSNSDPYASIEQLLRRFHQGDADAAWQLVLRADPLIAKTARRIGLGEPDELMNELRLQVYRSIVGGNDKERKKLKAQSAGEFLKYVAMVLHGKKVDLYRKLSKQHRESALSEEPAADAGDGPSLATDRFVVASMLSFGMFPPRQGEVLELDFYGNLSNEEIGKRLGTTTGAANKALLAARKRVQQFKATLAESGGPIITPEVRPLAEYGQVGDISLLTHLGRWLAEARSDAQDSTSELQPGMEIDCLHRYRLVQLIERSPGHEIWRATPDLGNWSEEGKPLFRVQDPWEAWEKAQEITADIRLADSPTTPDTGLPGWRVFQYARKAVKPTNGLGGLATALFAPKGDVLLTLLSQRRHGILNEMLFAGMTTALPCPNLLWTYRLAGNSTWMAFANELPDETLADVYAREEREGKPGIEKQKLIPWLAQAATGLDYICSLGFRYRGPVLPKDLHLVNGKVKLCPAGHVALGEASEDLCLSGAAGAYIAADQVSLALTYICLLTGHACVDLDHDGSLVRFGPDNLPKEEQPIVGKASEKNPADRWGSCSEFIRELAVKANVPLP